MHIIYLSLELNILRIFVLNLFFKNRERDGVHSNASNLTDELCSGRVNVVLR